MSKTKFLGIISYSCSNMFLHLLYPFLIPFSVDLRCTIVSTNHRTHTSFLHFSCISLLVFVYIFLYLNSLIRCCQVKPISFQGAVWFSTCPCQIQIEASYPKKKAMFRLFSIILYVNYMVYYGSKYWY